MMRCRPFVASLAASATAFSVLVGVGGTPVARAEVSSVPDHVFATDGTVDAIAPAGNTVYIGGEFKELGTPSGPGAALSRATGRLRPAFPTVAAGGQGPGDGVYAVIGDGAGGWYLGGGDITVGGGARHGMAPGLFDGRGDQPVDPQPHNNGVGPAILGRAP